VAAQRAPTGGSGAGAAGERRGRGRDVRSSGRGRGGRVGGGRGGRVGGGAGHTGRGDRETLRKVREEREEIRLREVKNKKNITS
jgi:hypothetical protein